MVNKALHDSALGSINAHKSIWNRADVNYQISNAELVVLDSKDESGFEAKKTARKIQQLKDRIIQQQITKKNAKAEISILEQQTWKQELTDSSENSIDKIKDSPKEKSDQVDPSRFKKKSLYA